MRVPLKVQSVDTGHPLAIDALLDSGATGMFIDIEFFQAKRLKTRHLPRAIPSIILMALLMKQAQSRKKLTSSVHMETTQNVPHSLSLAWIT